MSTQETTDSKKSNKVSSNQPKKQKKQNPTTIKKPSLLFTTIKVILIAFLLYVIYHSIVLPIEPSPIQATLLKSYKDQQQIINQGKLLDANGRLIDAGWSRHGAIQTFSSAAISPPLLLPQLNSLRLKKFQFYNVITSQIMAFFIVANVGYSASVQVLIWDMDKNEIFSMDEVVQNPSLFPDLLDSSSDWVGDLKAKTKYFEFTIENLKDGDHLYNFANIFVNATKDNVALEINLKFRKNQTQDDITLMAPINEDGSQFFYNIQSFSLDVRGSINYNGTNYQVKRRSLGCRDWGRGIFNYNTYWFWAYGQGYLKDEITQKLDFNRTVAINLGRGYENANAVNAYEDSLFLEGKIIQLNPTETVQHIDEKDYEAIIFSSHGMNRDGNQNKENVLPGSFVVVFEPDIALDRKVNYVLIQSQMQMKFGSYSGWVIDHDHRNISFVVPGFFEENKSKW